MEKLEEKNTLQLGAELDKGFVEKFREYCRKNDFKQKTLIKRLAEWWLGQDPLVQEHVYRGRLQEALLGTRLITETNNIDSDSPRVQIQKIKDMVRNMKKSDIRLLSEAESRELQKLRDALGPDPKKQTQKRKRG